MINQVLSKFAASVGALAFASMAVVSSTQAATELTVYTAVEAEDLKKYAKAFNAINPDIKIKWVRDSTGIVTAKLLAEKKNPVADVVWGLAATSLMLLKEEGMTHGYAPKGVDLLDKKFVDTAKPPHWTGMDAWIASVCYNTVEADKKKSPIANIMG
jgi:iron(III) transport system substrate-binding protein